MASRTKTPPPANRTQRAQQRRKRRTPLTLILVPVALIVGGAVLFLFLTGGADRVKDVVPGLGGDEPVPEFSFKLSKVQVISTAEDADNAALKPLAESTAAEVTPVLDEYFTNAFLDPNLWKDADYADAFAAFSEGAQPQALAQGIETLTLGEGAGDTYETVTPSKGSIRFDVLFDLEGNASDVAAHVRFYATAQRKDSTYVAIVSHGVLFLHDDGGWRITAYDMKRNDHETEAPPAAGTSGASGGSAASTGATGAS